MSEGSGGPGPQSAKPMPAIERIRLFQTDNPNLIGIGFDTPVGSVLLAANRAKVVELIAQLQAILPLMHEPH
jgi:hypothetical protein